ncbi:hypothetical protein ACO22_06875 [Paracoccidioides brasiliensis]|uniref:Uncharacterized protein n=1 Tax=Paracoccidioides brasiliensis TaxID=121759 RepID=A0A1D2J6B8_PARBR|nr:hypothetical protein ACO22_06875 [Paracoccidioides brasiliensis]
MAAQPTGKTFAEESGSQTKERPHTPSRRSPRLCNEYQVPSEWDTKRRVLSPPTASRPRDTLSHELINQNQKCKHAESLQNPLERLGHPPPDEKQETENERKLIPI